MPQNRMIILAALCLVVLDVIWFLIRGKKNGFITKEQCSKQLFVKAGAGYFLSLCLMVLLWFREFGLFSDIILAGCSVLAIEIENRLLLGSISEYDED